MTELTAPNVVASSTRSDRRRKILQNLLRGERPYMLYIAFVILLVVFSLSSPWFLSVDNFLNIGRQTTLVSIIAVGMTFIIIARQIDLSVASTLALSGMAAALAMSQINNSWIVGAVAGLGTGALVGLLNGILTTQLSIPSFLVTLGSLSMARGLAMMVTNTKPVIITNETYFAIFGEGTFLGIPVPIAWTLAAMIVGILLLHYNVFGRRIYAVGGNPTAALYSGINTKRITTAAFVLTGTLAGLSGAGAVGAFTCRAAGCRAGHGARRHRRGDPRWLQPVRRARLHPGNAVRQPDHRHTQQRPCSARRELADAARDQGRDHRRRGCFHETLVEVRRGA